jgi:hypothetical protein
MGLIDFRQTSASTNRIRPAGCGVAHGQLQLAKAGALLPDAPVSLCDRSFDTLILNGAKLRQGAMRVDGISRPRDID